MRKWEAVLRRDSAAWDDFKAWLGEMATTETTNLMQVQPSNLAHQQGKVRGIEHVLHVATANEREEQARARTGR